MSAQLAAPMAAMTLSALAVLCLVIVASLVFEREDLGVPEPFRVGPAWALVPSGEWALPVAGPNWSRGPA